MAGVGFAIAGLALSAGSAGFSFAQAGASKRAQRDAESKADAMMRQARRRLDINYMEQLAIKKEPYELQREALLQQGATALEAAREGDQRGVAATAGRLQQAQNQAQAGVRTAMGQELQQIEKAVALEDSRLRDLNVQLDLGEIAGAQQAAADAETRAAAQMASGVQATAGALQQGLSMGQLYSADTKAQKAALSNLNLSEAELKAAGLEGVDLQAIGAGTNKQFRKFRRGLDDTQTMGLFGSQAFQDQYALGLTANQNIFQRNEANQQRIADLTAKQSAGTITQAEINELIQLQGVLSTLPLSPAGVTMMGGAPSATPIFPQSS